MTPTGMGSFTHNRWACDRSWTILVKLGGYLAAKLPRKAVHIFHQAHERVLKPSVQREKTELDTNRSSSHAG